MKKNLRLRIATKPTTKSTLSERLLVSLTAEERAQLEAQAAKMSAELGVPVSLSACGRALLMASLKRLVES